MSDYWNIVLSLVPRAVNDQEQANIQQADFLVRTLVECDRLAEQAGHLRQSPAIERIRKLCERGIWDLIDNWRWRDPAREAHLRAAALEEDARAHAARLKLDRHRAEKRAAEIAAGPSAWRDQ